MKDAPEPATPVFVDRTGRRRRWFALFGAAGGGLLSVATVVLVAGFLGAGGALPGLPGSEQGGGAAAASAPVAGADLSPSRRPARDA